jgi:hypothetical protein
MGTPGFQDVTVAAGVADGDNGTGVVFADFDRDGDQDLFIAKGGFTAFGQANRMFRNEGDGSFSGISAEAGVDVNRSSYAAVVGDYDLDGYLDLYVSQLRGQEATLYRNRQGRFEDVTQSKRILTSSTPAPPPPSATTTTTVISTSTPVCSATSTGFTPTLATPPSPSSRWGARETWWV